MNARKLTESMLDNIYFSLPIEWGQASALAASFGICYLTLLRGLRMLEAEGLASHPRHGYWIENLED